MNIGIKITEYKPFRVLVLKEMFYAFSDYCPLGIAPSYNAP